MKLPLTVLAASSLRAKTKPNANPLIVQSV